MVAGAAEPLERTERHEPGRQQRPDACRVARRDRRQGELAGRDGAQGIVDQLRSAARPAVRGFELETHLGEPGDSLADNGQGRAVRVGVTHRLGMIADPAREQGPRVGGEVGPGDQPVGDVWRHGEHGVPGERDDDLQPGTPRRHAPPAPVGIGNRPAAAAAMSLARGWPRGTPPAVQIQFRTGPPGPPDR
jgi:hypothetical protein